MSLLDEAIKVGQALEQSDQRLQTAKQQLDEVEAALAARRQELSILERESAQHVQDERTAWENAQREQEAILSQRLEDLRTREAAVVGLPAQLAQLATDQDAAHRAQAEAQAQWRAAKDAEQHWQARNHELDAKAEAINQLAANAGVTALAEHAEPPAGTPS